ncbi:MAG: carbohydrate kinase [Bacteroidales bacterium]|nr:carbohydrate kinase [Bacteroidales bacterium]
MERFVVGIGDALWDCLPEGRKIGGAPANFAYYMMQFGYDSLAVSAVGNDDLGAEIKETFNRIGLKHILDVSEYPTGTVTVELDANGIPSYDIKENVAYDHITYTPQLEEIAGKCNVACFGSMSQRNPASRTTIRKFLESMPYTDDTYKVFDINLRQNFYDKEIISESLKLCNVFKINDEELLTVKKMFGYDEESDQETCRRLIEEWDLEYLILTCGVNGSHIFTDKEYSFLDTPEVDVADTVGAGDSFISAFMASVLNGESIREAHKRAVDVSAYVCTQYGAMLELPSELTGK